MAVQELFTFVIVLVVVGALMWAINVFLPMDGRIKQAVIGLIGFIAVIWVLFRLVAVMGIQ
jgi:hypothetical protein